MTIPPPLPNGANGGRDPKGRFAKGNPGGPGNPDAAKVARLRTALLEAVSAGDVKAIIKSLVKQAKHGDVAAAKVTLDRLLGPPLPLDFQERLARLEEILAAKEAEKCGKTG